MKRQNPRFRIEGGGFCFGSIRKTAPGQLQLPHSDIAGDARGKYISAFVQRFADFAGHGIKTSFAFTQIHTMKPINCILLCLGLFCLLTCASKSVAPGIQLDMKETECGACKVLKKISRETGIVRYDADERKYAVVVTVPNTYDSQNVGFVCNLPASLQKEGVSINFDGEYRPHGKKPMLGGLKY